VSARVRGGTGVSELAVTQSVTQAELHSLVFDYVLEARVSLRRPEIQIGVGRCSPAGPSPQDPAGAAATACCQSSVRSSRGRELDALLCVTETDHQLHTTAVKATPRWTKIAGGRGDQRDAGPAGPTTALPIVSQSLATGPDRNS